MDYMNVYIYNYIYIYIIYVCEPPEKPRQY